MLDFTKGEWKYFLPAGIGKYYEVQSNLTPSGKIHAEIAGHIFNKDDARLIAAAPKLYDIVKSLTECKPHSFSELKMRAHDFIKQLEQENSNG